ncbi:OmpA family protein [Guyparkeria sp.]|uniref:OmpA family protein n=1 Tax=Guyparkeria sp. TaxID=2035736 RepID=UPI003970B945
MSAQVSARVGIGKGELAVKKEVNKSAKQVALRMAGIIMVTSMVGCVSPPNNDRTPVREADDDFPSLDSNWYDGGKFVNPESVLRVRNGQTKDQVRQLLGNPHFAEGFFRVREWNYVFNFYTGEGDDYCTCQYKVLYDENMVLESTHWRKVYCEELVNRVVTTEEEDRETLALSGDALFEFDSANITLEGERALRRVIREAAQDFNDPQFEVVGYTDRLGTEEYNLRLSYSRAEAVMDYLVQSGIDEDSILVYGRGMQDPVVECPGTSPFPELKECLKPNRRVEISVFPQY